jgi:hypothetical protein
MVDDNKGLNLNRNGDSTCVPPPITESRLDSINLALFCKPGYIDWLHISETKKLIMFYISYLQNKMKTYEVTLLIFIMKPMAS